MSDRTSPTLLETIELNKLILPLRVVPQPIPAIYVEGDCGACVLAGLLGIGIQEVYKRNGRIRPVIDVRSFCHDRGYQETRD